MSTEENEDRQPDIYQLSDEYAQPEAASHSSPSSSSGTAQTPVIPLPQKRHRRLELVLLLFLLALIIVSATPLRNVVLQLFFPSPSTPAAKITPGDDLFYFDIPWGDITIDGKTILNPPTDLTSPYPPLRLAPSMHTIVWHAAPLQPVTCVFSVPSSSKQPACPGFSGVMTVSVVPSSRGVQIRRLAFQASLALLSTSLRQELLQAIQAALDDSSGTVQILPGESYVQSVQGAPPGVGTIVKAPQILHAQLHLQLDTDLNSPYACGNYGDLCNNNGQDCHEICSEGASDASWPAIVLFYSSWTYQTPDGHIVAQNQPDTITNAYGTEHSIPMSLQWDGQRWHAALMSSESFTPEEKSYTSTDPACAQVTSMFIGDGHYAGTEASPPATVTWSFFPAKNRADGCLAVARHASLSSTTSPVPATYCLYRAGVLIAANDQAHQDWPELPVADAFERQSIQQIAAAYSQEISQVT